MEQKTEEERIAIIRDAYLQSKDIGLSKSAESFVEEVLTEKVIADNGLFDVQKEDIEDEAQFLNSDSAEDIDEEDEDMGVVSDEMKGVYQS